MALTGAIVQSRTHLSLSPLSTLPSRRDSRHELGDFRQEQFPLTLLLEGPLDIRGLRARTTPLRVSRLLSVSDGRHRIFQHNMVGCSPGDRIPLFKRKSLTAAFDRMRGFDRELGSTMKLRRGRSVLKVLPGIAGQTWSGGGQK